MSFGIDALLLVPLQPPGGSLADPHVRKTLGPDFYMHIGRAISDVESYLGRGINPWAKDGPVFSDGTKFEPVAQRTLSSVALATVLERAGLRWRILDPGQKEIAWYRHELERLGDLDPAVIGISSTFVTRGAWLRALITVVRRAFPRAKIVVGGYYYTTNTKDFLTLDADVLFVGEGEVRLPTVIRALRDGTSLRDVRGLYLRRPDGRLEYTGVSEQINVAEHCRPDWRLVSRIDPPVNLETDNLELGVETQRGCVFKCEYCTFRTLLSSPSLMDPDEAIAPIFDTALAKRAGIMLTDATATFPHKRWEEIVKRIADRGGAPHPIWCYARVSDIDEPIAELMARANIRTVFIGQESGDQRVLDLMKKGTKISHVVPAVRALSKHDITASIGMIIGFPGETSESLANSRRLIANINAETPDRPTVLMYMLTPFALYDFAGAAEDEDFRRDHHYWNYNDEFDAERAGRECIRTIVETSKIPHAPYSFINLGGIGTSSISMEILCHPLKYEVFHWLKAVDRALGIFLEHHALGARLDRAELARVRSKILAPLPPPQRRLDVARIRASRGLQARAIGALQREWKREQKTGGVGPLTSLAVAASVFRDTGRLGETAAAYQTGTYASEGAEKAESPEIVELANALITDATKRARVAKLPVLQRR